MGITRIVMLAATLLSPIDEPPSKPAVSIDLGSPQKELEWVLTLFRTASVSDPATALANWKRATKGKISLGKGQEAAIAAINPAMAKELKVLKDSEFVLDFDAKTGAPRWFLAVPKDDGTLSSFATAMALTDGGSEKPLGDASVDRLGNKQGAGLMARQGDQVVIGTTRDSLAEGFALLSNRRPIPFGSLVQYQVDGDGLLRSVDVRVRRVGEILRGLRISDCKGFATFVGGEPSLTNDCKTTLGDSGSTLDRRWLADFPAEPSLAFSFVIDPRRDSWDRFFVMADRVEKADPANARLSPLRPRIGVFCRLAGVDVEADVWPKIQGISGFVVGEARKPQTVALAIHAIDAAAAERFSDHVFPKIAKSIGLGPSTDNPRAYRKAMGELQGKTLWVIRSDPKTVWISWGDEFLGMVAVPKLVHRLVPATGRPLQKPISEYQRIGWMWPSRLGLMPKDSPLSLALDRADPIEWTGRIQGGSQIDEMKLGGLDRAIRRFLELIPQEPLPEARK